VQIFSTDLALHLPGWPWPGGAWQFVILWYAKLVQRLHSEWDLIALKSWEVNLGLWETRGWKPLVCVLNSRNRDFYFHAPLGQYPFAFNDLRAKFPRKQRESFSKWNIKLCPVRK